MEPTTIHAGRMRLTGDVRAPASLAVADLRELPQRETAVSFECSTSGLRRHRFAGPLLIDVVHAAQPLFEAGERKDRLRFLVSVFGADGHHAVLSWGEIDPEFGNTQVLLGVSMDGRALDEQGPHLVVPGDRCGARNISGIAEIQLARLRAARFPG
ncbi:molybdopterin-binding oxidoreductase [Acrocarpospora phusangensis]|uniref:Molybdopterin-binding oxidoreductase n=1 Tax=Acrocarpospora phusangensis TaxID=1070424 RepID=A0A919QGH3_9ACTN|nr:molybdopterin-dependent oxidoreductase [Acrocarpospora phusangensis]GIH25782.1 molybdopterin-binding oxidoreductase [Acrocarpospora phusangensis]